VGVDADGDAGADSAVAVELAGGADVGAGCELAGVPAGAAALSLDCGPCQHAATSAAASVTMNLHLLFARADLSVRRCDAGMVIG
jgi:hypothetical protein